MAVGWTEGIQDEAGTLEKEQVPAEKYSFSWGRGTRLLCPRCVQVEMVHAGGGGRWFQESGGGHPRESDCGGGWTESFSVGACTLQGGTDGSVVIFCDVKIKIKKINRRKVVSSEWVGQLRIKPQVRPPTQVRLPLWQPCSPAPAHGFLGVLPSPAACPARDPLLPTCSPWLRNPALTSFSDTLFGSLSFPR